MKTITLILASTLILTGCWNSKITEKNPVEKAAIPGAEIVSSPRADTNVASSTGSTETSKTQYHAAP